MSSNNNQQARISGFLKFLGLYIVSLLLIAVSVKSYDSIDGEVYSDCASNLNAKTQEVDNLLKNKDAQDLVFKKLNEHFIKIKTSLDSISIMNDKHATLIEDELKEHEQIEVERIVGILEGTIKKEKEDVGNLITGNMPILESSESLINHYDVYLDRLLNASKLQRKNNIAIVGLRQNIEDLQMLSPKGGGGNSNANPCQEIEKNNRELRERVQELGAELRIYTSASGKKALEVTYTSKEKRNIQADARKIIELTTNTKAKVKGIKNIVGFNKKGKNEIIGKIDEIRRYANRILGL